MKRLTALIMSAVMMLCVCSACGTKKEQVNSPQQASNSTETKTEEQGSDITKALDTDSVSYTTNVPFELNDYIYYFSDAYFENNEFSFEGERYNSLYRMDKNGNGKEKVYSGTDIGVYNFGYAEDVEYVEEYHEYTYNDCIYIIDNINSDEPKKVSRVSLGTGKCESLFEDILTDKNTLSLEDRIKIYKDGLFYLKKNNSKSEAKCVELWYSSTDGKTSLVCDGVNSQNCYYVVGNQLMVSTTDGQKAFKAYSPYEEIPVFMYESERPIRTDTTGKIAVSYRSLDSGENEMYKYDIDSGDETVLRTGYICACEIVSDVIIFTEYKNGKCDVYQMDLNGENVKQLS